MSKRIKALTIMLIIALLSGLLPVAASASIRVEVDNEVTIETETEETTTRSSDLTEYTSTVTTTTTTTAASSLEIDFLPARRIEHVPDTAIIGVPLRLVGSVYPRNATNRRIVWDVYDAGTTRATITGDDVLNVRATGTVTVRAIIHNGNYAQPDYIQTFSVSAIVPRFDRAPVMITNVAQPANFPNSGNFRDLYSVRINDYELTLTDDNERILLFGFPEFRGAVGEVIGDSNIIRLYSAFLRFIPDDIYTLTATFRHEQANGRTGRAYAVNETIFILGRMTRAGEIPDVAGTSNTTGSYNSNREPGGEIPQTGNISFVSEAIAVLTISLFGMSGLFVLHRRDKVRKSRSR